AAPCPPWLKEAWIRWLGAERIFELYGGTERIGSTIIRGDEWLAKPGSAGRPGSACGRCVQTARSVTLERWESCTSSLPRAPGPPFTTSATKSSGRAK